MHFVSLLYAALGKNLSVILVVFAGVYLTIRLGFPQVVLFPKAISYFVHSVSERHSNQAITPLKALCTSLGATVGVGNIAGVAGALALGGPGSLFWIWIYGFLGMAIKFTEAVMGRACLVGSASGNSIGGPMYFLSGKYFQMAKAYALFCLVASFGTGNAAQVNAIISSVSAIPFLNLNWKVRITIAIAVGLCVVFLLLAGMKKVTGFLEFLVPFTAMLYMIICLCLIMFQRQYILCVLRSILVGAFQPRSVTGGAIGSFLISFRTGISRGVFSCEAGMGTASIAHSIGNTNHPVESGYMGLMEAFIDTMLICPLTGIAILCSGVKIEYGNDLGASLTIDAFTRVLGSVAPVFLSFIICLLSFASILGWGIYGGAALRFLGWDRKWHGYVWTQGILSCVAVWIPTGTVWRISETINGLLLLPGIFALWHFQRIVTDLRKEYQYIQETGKTVIGGTYENIYQCKSV